MSYQAKGIDVSCWNETIDWQKVKSAGIQFVMIRAGYGDNISQVDKYFKTHIDGALAAGLHVGIYWMSYAVSVSDAVLEAKVVKQVITKYSGKIDFPVCFDWEYASEDYFVKQIGRHPTDAEISNMVVAFCGELKKGCWYAANYQNLDFTAHKLDSSIVKDVNVWLADYSGGPDVACGMQQTSEDGHIDGVSGHVDTDTAFIDYPAAIRVAGLNGYAKAVTVANAGPLSLDTQSKDMRPGEKYTVLARCAVKPAVDVTGNDRITVSAPRVDPRGWLIDVTAKTPGYAHISVSAGGVPKQCSFNVK